MITKKERINIKNVLGNHYSKPIQKYLNEKKIYNIKGESYSLQSIRNIVNGVRANHKIVEAIGELITSIKPRKKIE